MKKILALSNDKHWILDFSHIFKLKFRASEAHAEFVSNRAEALNEIVREKYDLFLITASTPKKEVELLFRYIATNENFKMNIFFLSEDFEQFNEILKITNFPKIHLFSTPMENPELVKQIHNTIYPITNQNSYDQNFKVNLEFLKTFVESTKYILDKFCLLKEVKHRKPMLLDISNIKMYDLEGFVELESDLFSGVFYVCFNQDTYLKIVEHVMMDKFNEINEDNVDFAAEIVNMVYGQAKITLNQSGHNFKKVIPKFTIKPALHNTKNVVTVVPIDTDMGVIDIKVEMTKKINSKQ